MDHSTFALDNPRAALFVAETPPQQPPPFKDAQEWVKNLPLGGIDSVFVYGLGRGEILSAFDDWLKINSHELIILEDDYSTLRYVLDLELPTSKKVKILAFQESIETDPLIKSLAWKSLRKNFLIVSLPDYLQRKKPSFDLLRERLTYEITEKKEAVDEYEKFGIVFYRNFYANLSFLPEALNGEKMKGAFTDVPAVIVGAGPSLKKSLPSFPSLKNKALIFAGGSALNALHANNIVPDFAGGIDPNPLQLERFESHTLKHLPLFYRSRFNHRALKILTGPKIYIPGSGGYDTAEWFEKRLEFQEETLDEGHNVINFLTAIAESLGCNPIIFVGVDLAYTGGKTYAEGVVANSSLTHNKDLHLVEAVDIFGHPVMTEWKWQAESKWLSQFSQDHPNKTFINATDGGLGFAGVINRSLSTVVPSLIKEYPLNNLIQKALSLGKNTITKEMVESSLLELKESLVRSKEALDILLEDNQQKQDFLKKGIFSDVDQSGEAVLAELELSEEEAFKGVLEMFSTVWTFSHQEELSHLKSLSDREKRERLLQLNQEKYLFLSRVIDANLLLINDSNC